LYLDLLNERDVHRSPLLAASSTANRLAA